jgi:hypothetical protein
MAARGGGPVTVTILFTDTVASTELLGLSSLSSDPRTGPLDRVHR